MFTLDTRINDEESKKNLEANKKKNHSRQRHFILFWKFMTAKATKIWQPCQLMEMTPAGNTIFIKIQNDCSEIDYLSND